MSVKVEAEGADGLNELRFNMPSWQDFRSSCCGAAHHCSIRDRCQAFVNATGEDDAGIGHRAVFGHDDVNAGGKEDLCGSF